MFMFIKNGESCFYFVDFFVPLSLKKKPKRLEGSRHTHSNPNKMKKILVSLFAVAALFIVSCGSSPEVKETLDCVKEYTAKIEKATTMDEVLALQSEVIDKVAEIAQKNPDATMTSSDEKELEAAMTALTEAATKRIQEVGAAGISGNDAAEEETEEAEE
jgi:hypothetical protein